MKIEYKENDEDYTDEEFTYIYNEWKKGVNVDPRSIFVSCGTLAGESRHRRWKNSKCWPCRWGYAEYRKNLNHRQGKNKKYINSIALCGTISGYDLHKRKNDEACEKCREAANQYEKERKWQLGETVPMGEYLRKQPKPYTDYFNATFLGNLTKKIENRFDFWFRSSRKYGFTRQEINEFHGQHFNCFHCKKHLLNEVIHIDHLLPVSRGGRNEIENLVLSCAICNSTKRDLTLEEWEEFNA